MRHFTVPKHILTFLIFIITLLIFSSCAEREVVDACLEGKTYGFWSGLWHGIIAPIDLIVMIFDKDITMFATNNNGAWYSFGFLLGSGGWGIIGGKGIFRGN